MSKTLYISTNFNPAGFESHKKNLKTFVDNFPEDAPLLVTEVLFGNSGGILSDSTKFKSNSILWQKERALNALIKNSWDNYENIVWCDGDILLPDPDFLDKVSLAFHDYDVIQGFKTCRLMSKEDTKSYQDYGVNFCSSEPIPSIVSNFFAKSKHPGLIWGAKTSFLKKVNGLFDIGILGGGDSLFISALLGQVSQVTQQIGRHHQRYVDLVSEASPTIGFVDTEIFHQYHGSAKNRKYGERYQIANKYLFDPIMDLNNGEGTYEWSAHASEPFRNEVANYFLQRREDE